MRQTLSVITLACLLAFGQPVPSAPLATAEQRQRLSARPIAPAEVQPASLPAGASALQMGVAASNRMAQAMAYLWGQAHEATHLPSMVLAPSELELLLVHDQWERFITEAPGYNHHVHLDPDMVQRWSTQMAQDLA